MTEPWSREEFENQLREKGRGYHIYHPFHVLMYEGKLTKEQLQSWVANRFYYQIGIPQKDAAILSNCPDKEIRKEWDIQFASQKFEAGSNPIVNDKSGQSIEHIDQYTFKDGAVAKITCRNFSEQMKAQSQDQDDFSVFYESANFAKWMKLYLIKLITD